MGDSTSTFNSIQYHTSFVLSSQSILFLNVAKVVKIVRTQNPCSCSMTPITRTFDPDSDPNSEATTVTTGWILAIYSTIL